MVTPDGESFDLADVSAGLVCQLGNTSVMVESCQSGEAGWVDVWCISGGDESVGVGWVSDNNNSDCVSVSVVIDGLSLNSEKSSVVLQQILSFHSLSSWLGSDEESKVSSFESLVGIVCGCDAVQEWESTVLEFHNNSLKSILGLWEFQELQDNGLVWSQKLSTGDTEESSVSDLSSSTSDCDSGWCLGCEAGVVSDSGEDRSRRSAS